MTNRTIVSLSFAIVLAATASAQVYTQTNEVSSNRIAELNLNSDGSLTRARYIPTGGHGTGAGLGVQGAVSLSADHRFLFAVNAGSNDISTFLLGEGGARLVSRVPSGGNRPISVTSTQNFVYVVNAGSSNIAGFWLSPNGQLSPISGSVQPLSAAGVAPGQISFNPEGDTLYVTEKDTNRIDYYAVDSAGVASAPSWVPAPGLTPFGFDFGRRGKLIVSEAFGGQPGASAVSVFTSNDPGKPFVTAASVPTFQAAACWVAVSPDGQFAYTGNAGSDNISGYRIYSDGSLALLTGDGISARTLTGGGATDLGFSRTNNLYALSPKMGTILGYSTDVRGRLVKFTRVSGLPTTVTGIAIR